MDAGDNIVERDAPKETTRSSGVTKRPRVQKKALAGIAAKICAGDYAPGTLLPRENDLCEEFGVSRTVIREALKVLESKGMVRGKPRVGTSVCDKEDWNLLDPLVLEWLGPRILELDLLGSILEARRAFEPSAAAYAAKRATARDIADLEQSWQDMANAEGDVERFTAADVVFHTVLLKASHNRVFIQLSAILQSALNFMLLASNTAVESRDSALHRHKDLVEALRMRDAVSARAAVNAILDLAERDLSLALKDTDSARQ